MKLKNILSTSSLILISSAVYAQYDTVVMCRTCPAGYVGNGSGTECTNCGPGTYQDKVGQGSCISITDEKNCATGSANTSYTSCVNKAGRTKCDPKTCKATSCAAGYGLYSGECSPCGPGTYKSSDSSGTCSYVPAGNCSTGSANASYTSCISGGRSACNASNCKATSCKAGYYLSGGECYACGKGKYSSGGSGGYSSCYSCSGSSTSCGVTTTYCTSTVNSSSTANSSKSGTTCSNCRGGSCCSSLPSSTTGSCTCYCGTTNHSYSGTSTTSYSYESSNSCTIKSKTSCNCSGSNANACGESAGRTG